ncbi:MAG: 30S ribosomal protein S7, partial [archaeon]
MSEIKVFGKWDTSEVKVVDITLARQISLEPRIIPHSFGRGVKRAFAKEKISVVERLINKIMRSGQGKRKLSGKYIRGRGSCGKKVQAM